MAAEARRACIRHSGHPGPHRNRFWEWVEGQTGLAKLRLDIDTATKSR